MKRLTFNMWIFILLIVGAALFIGFIAHSIAQKQASTLSGRVVDVEGNPVAELPVFVRAVERPDGRNLFIFSSDHFDARYAHTDFDGRFSITDIPSGSICFGSLSDTIKTLISDDLEPNIKKALEKKDVAALRSSGIDQLESDDLESDVNILSLNVQGITFYPRRDFNKIVFAVKPGAHIENVLVKVKPRMRIRGRVVFKDGTPAANARLRVSIRYRYKDRDSSSSSKDENPRTDADGNFIVYLKERNKAASYTFSVRYMGLVTHSEPVLLNPGERLDGLTFTFDSEPIFPKPQPRKIETDASTTPKRQPRKAETKTEKSNPVQEHLSRQKPEEVWIVNPANGHAYKRVYCKTRDDAVAQATEEKAHLVTINDAKEQAWLNAVFGHQFYWIGLSDAKEEGKWQWHNGEPLNYENWLTEDYFSEFIDANDRDYVVTTFVDGKWYAVSPKSAITRMISTAIIEKADVKIKQSYKEK